MRIKTPRDLIITPRDRRFGRQSPQSRWWKGGDPVGTAVYNALSATFPKGEAFFVQSVKGFRDSAPPELAAEIQLFVMQEVMHSREHVAFNRRAHEAGYDLTALERRVEARLRVARSLPPVARLAVTMGLEHYTAMFAHEMLKNPVHLKGVDQETAALWRWHCLEEIEHKGVSYDAWLHATKDWPRFKRWSMKARVMVLVTQDFLMDRTDGALALLRQDGVTGAKAGWRLFWFTFGWPGMMRRIIGAWVSYFLPGFHPWNRDDRRLIEAEEAAIAA